jgi:hypothetical protein
MPEQPPLEQFPSLPKPELWGGRSFPWPDKNPGQPLFGDLPPLNPAQRVFEVFPPLSDSVPSTRPALQLSAYGPPPPIVSDPEALAKHQEVLRQRHLQWKKEKEEEKQRQQEKEERESHYRNHWSVMEEVELVKEHMHFLLQFLQTAKCYCFKWSWIKKSMYKDKDPDNWRTEKALMNKYRTLCQALLKEELKRGEVVGLDEDVVFDERYLFLTITARERFLYPG